MEISITNIFIIFFRVYLIFSYYISPYLLIVCGAEGGLEQRVAWSTSPERVGPSVPKFSSATGSTPMYLTPSSFRGLDVQLNPIGLLTYMLFSYILNISVNSPILTY